MGKKENLVTNEYKGFVEKPENAKEFFDQIRHKHKDCNLRVFVRGSGTEDVVRIHMEWKQSDSFGENELQETREKINHFLLNHPDLN